MQKRIYVVNRNDKVLEYIQEKIIKEFLGQEEHTVIDKGDLSAHKISELAESGPYESMMVLIAPPISIQTLTRAIWQSRRTIRYIMVSTAIKKVNKNRRYHFKFDDVPPEEVGSWLNISEYIGKTWWVEKAERPALFYIHRDYLYRLNHENSDSEEIHE